jgi:predicted Zn-dependent peptidase
MQKYVLSELDSGERVISEKVPSVRSVSLGFWIGAGSRDEPDAKAGVTHFIEHLLFKGTRSYDAADRRDIRRDGCGAERRDLPGAHGRLPRAGQARRGGARGDDDMVFAPAFAS